MASSSPQGKGDDGTLPFSPFLNNPEFHDVICMAGTSREPIYLHGVVLAAQSHRFCELLRSSSRTQNDYIISFPDLDRDLFLSLMEYMYSGKITVQENRWVKLFTLAENFGVNSLLFSLRKKFKTLDSQSMPQIFQQAVSLRSQSVIQICLELVASKPYQYFPNSRLLFCKEHIERLVSQISVMRKGSQREDLTPLLISWADEHASRCSCTRGLDPKQFVLTLWNQQGQDDTRNLPVVLLPSNSTIGLISSDRFKLELTPLYPFGEKVKVGGETRARNLAGLMALLAGDGKTRVLSAVGAIANNQAVKSIAITRSFVVADGHKFDVCFQPCFVRVDDLHEGDNGVEYTLLKAVITRSSDQIVERKVSKTTMVKSLAGSIAQNLRDGVEVAVIGVGPYCINQAVKAIAVARRFLEQDHHDLICLPEFTEVYYMHDAMRNAIRFRILPLRMLS